LRSGDVDRGSGMEGRAPPSWSDQSGARVQRRTTGRRGGHGL